MSSSAARTAILHHRFTIVEKGRRYCCVGPDSVSAHQRHDELRQKMGPSPGLRRIRTEFTRPCRAPKVEALPAVPPIAPVRWPRPLGWGRGTTPVQSTESRFITPDRVRSPVWLVLVGAWRPGGELRSDQNHATSPPRIGRFCQVEVGPSTISVPVGNCAAVEQSLSGTVQPHTVGSDLSWIHGQLSALIALVAVQPGGNSPLRADSRNFFNARDPAYFPISIGALLIFTVRPPPTTKNSSGRDSVSSMPPSFVRSEPVDQPRDNEASNTYPPNATDWLVRGLFA